MFLCVDKYAGNTKKTYMYEVPSVDSLNDDRDLFLLLGKSLVEARGTRLQRLFTIRSFSHIQLAKVSEPPLFMSRVPSVSVSVKWL